MKKSQELVANPGTHLYLARMEGKIVGSLSLVVFSIPTGTKVGLHKKSLHHSSLDSSNIQFYEGSD